MSIEAVAVSVVKIVQIDQRIYMLVSAMSLLGQHPKLGQVLFPPRQ